MARRGETSGPGRLDALLGAGTTLGLTDGQLVERFAARRSVESAESAFEALVSRHGPMVRRVCRQVLRGETDADDAFQAVFLVLARRAGARLQTLIIDEGFGSQDAKGREKLVECLNAIKDDFERIIVITHIDELKDAFANRIEVTKTPTGSQVVTMEGSAG